jgi:hypothetical protein
MKKKLLITGGVMNTLFALFHIWLGVAIQGNPAFTPAGKSLMQAFNVFGTGIMFYMAYIAFFLQRDMLETKLGRAMITMSAFIYLSRAVEEFILFKFSFVFFIPCVVLGGIYVALWFLTGNRKNL